MFESLSSLPADPILNLMALFRRDNNPDKVDLGVGVYRNEQGHAPVMAAIKAAEKRVIIEQTTKSYVGPSGDPVFNEHIKHLLWGSSHPVIRDQRIVIAQTPGGCGALRVAAELIMRAKPEAHIWVSDPSWDNHIPLLGDSGLHIQTYPYYDLVASQLCFDKMMAALDSARSGDLVLLHGCCHNPSGADLSESQWAILADFFEQRGLVPFVDVAYQGLGRGVDEDVTGLRYLSERLPEVLVAFSASKSFGLYRERAGALALVLPNLMGAQAIATHINCIARGIYSMPPAHGASLVAEVLKDTSLATSWRDELEVMRQRINTLRTEFSQGMADLVGTGRFDFVANQKGLFSFLGINPTQVDRLAREQSIYMLQSSRINIAGLSRDNLARVCAGIAKVITS